MLVALHVVVVELAERLPVQVAELVARRVLLVLGELHALPLVGALVQAGEHALHHRAGAQLHPGELGERCRVEQRHGASAASPSPPRGAGRRASREVMPSLSAWKLGSTRWRSTGRASARTSSTVAAKRPWRTARALAASTRYWLARGPAPQDTFLRTELGRARLLGPGLPHQLHRVAHHVVRHRHAAHQLLQGEDLLRREHLGQRGLRPRGGALDDLHLLLGASGSPRPPGT